MYASKDELTTALSRWPLGVGWKRLERSQGKIKVILWLVRSARRQKSFAILISHLGCLACALKWFSFPKDILSCNCRFPFSVLVLSHSALDISSKFFLRRCSKCLCRAEEGSMVWPMWIFQFFPACNGVVMAKQLLAQLDEQLAMVGLGDILSLIELLYKLY